MNYTKYNKGISSSIGGGAPQQPDYTWVSGTCFAKTSDPCERKITEVNMNEKSNITYKNESISHNDLFAYSPIHLFTYYIFYYTIFLKFDKEKE